MTVILFYLFAAVIVFSAVMVIAARNPVHAVLFLILAFLNAAGVFLLAGAEFLALILAIVYVGAVAVLFLFVVMMLDVDFTALRKGATRHLSLGLMVGLVLLAELSMLATAWPGQDNGTQGGGLDTAVSPVSNTEALGAVLYTDYMLVFFGAGVVLLVAMAGSIVLTLREREGVRRQSISAQLARRPEDTLDIRKIASGEGIG
jgi:NADH-quinone oxidoreductase subunit J